MKKKKVLSMTLAAILAFSLAACGSSSNSSSGSASSGTTSSDTGAAAASSADTGASASDSEYDDDATVVWGITSAWADLTPFSNNSGGSYSGIVISLIYDKLVYCTKDGTISPRAAKSWEMADDNMSIIFNLDENSKFHDGEPVKASDWVFAMNLLADPASGFADHSQMNLYAGTNDAGDLIEGETLGVEALDDYTLKVSFKKPIKEQTFLVSYSWQLTPLPEHLLADVPVENIAQNDFFQAPVGSGPCKFESVMAGSELTLSRFTDYPIGEAHFGKMVLRVMSSSALATALMTGEIDVNFSGISNDEAKELDGMDGVTVIYGDSPATSWYMSFNNCVITDERVRKAADFAINKNVIADSLLQGEAEPMEVFLPEGHEFIPDDVKYEYNPDKGKELLEAAMADGYDGKLILATSSGTRESMCVLIEQDLEAIGFDVEIQVVDGTTMFADLRNEENGTYSAGIIGLGISPDVCYYDAQIDPSIVSLSSVKDMKFKEYQDAYQAASDDSEAKKIFGEYLEYVYEQMPVIFLVGTYDDICYTSRMGDIALDIGAIQLRNVGVWNWKVSK